MTSREKEVARLSKRIARGLVADLVSGRQRSGAAESLVSTLRRAAADRSGPGGPRRRSAGLVAADAQKTFLAVAVNRGEMEAIKARARPAGVSVNAWGRVAFGLPARQSS
jgi:hypothetical protein